MCCCVQDALLSSLLLFVVVKKPWRIYIDAWQRCNLLSLLQRRANKRSCLCAVRFGQNTNAAAQSAHSRWGLMFFCMHCSYRRFFLSYDRGNSAFILCLRYTVKVGAHDSFICFPWVFSPHSVPLDAWIIYLTYGKKCEGIQGQWKWIELSVRHKCTQTDSNVRHQPQTHTDVYVSEL